MTVSAKSAANQSPHLIARVSLLRNAGRRLREIEHMRERHAGPALIASVSLRVAERPWPYIYGI